MTSESPDPVQGRDAVAQDPGAVEVELTEDLLDQVAGAGLLDFNFTVN